MKGHIKVLVELASPGLMRVSVSDSGIGIAKAEQAHLFKLFGKLEGNELLNPHGCGLGLSIANAIAFELGGKSIALLSDLGCGATFSFLVTISDMREVASSVNPSAEFDQICEIPEETQQFLSVPQLLRSDHDFAKARRNPSVLVVDDVEFNLLVMRKMLSALGVESDQANTGREAIAQILKAKRERGYFYKVVLMDLEMPEMDGLTATREIFALVERGELPFLPAIIACSAYSSKEDKELCRQAGMKAYLEKPASRESLKTLLDAYL